MKALAQLHKGQNRICPTDSYSAAIDIAAQSISKSACAAATD